MSFMKSTKKKNYSDEHLNKVGEERIQDSEVKSNNYFIDPDGYFKKVWTIFVLALCNISSFTYATYASLRTKTSFWD